MSHHYQIVACRLAHIREILRTMRPADRAEFTMAGVNPKHRLHELYRITLEPKTALVDGDVAAIWGDAASLLAGEGLMWLVTSPAIEKLPLAFFRESRAELRALLERRRKLRSCIAGPYRKAIRFFTLLGFKVEPPDIIGGQEYRQISMVRHG